PRTPPEFCCRRYPDQTTEPARRSISLRDSWHRIVLLRIPRARATSDSRPPADRRTKRNCSQRDLQTSIPSFAPARRWLFRRRQTAHSARPVRITCRNCRAFVCTRQKASPAPCRVGRFATTPRRTVPGTPCRKRRAEQKAGAVPRPLRSRLDGAAHPQTTVPRCDRRASTGERSRKAQGRVQRHPRLVSIAPRADMPGRLFRRFRVFRQARQVVSGGPDFQDRAGQPSEGTRTPTSSPSDPGTVVLRWSKTQSLRESCFAFAERTHTGPADSLVADRFSSAA